MGIQADAAGKLFRLQIIVPKQYEKNDKIPYKDVVHLLQYVFNKDTNE